MTSMYEQAQKRPPNYEKLSPQEQWAIDKELGILDWDGKDDRPISTAEQAGKGATDVFGRRRLSFAYRRLPHLRR